MPNHFSTATGGTGTYTDNIMRRFPLDGFHANIQFNRNLHRQTILVGSEARHDMAH